MKIILIAIASLTVLSVGGAFYLLNHGYAYTFPSLQQQEGAAYRYSPQCEAQKQQGQALIAPLQAQYNTLANTIIDSPKPLDNGQALVDQSEALQAKINAIETKYDSC